jgi:hypothetical protein
VLPNIGVIIIDVISAVYYYYYFDQAIHLFLFPQAGCESGCCGWWWKKARSAWCGGQS